MVTAQLFLRPLIAALTGAAPNDTAPQRAHTLTPLPASGAREEIDALKAELAQLKSGQ